LRRTPTWATKTVMPITTSDERKPPITEITTKSATEIVFSIPNATQIALASKASTNDTDNDIDSDAARFLPDQGVAPARHAERAGVHGGTETTAEGRRTRAAHADGGGNEDEEAGKTFERAGDRAERQPGNQVTARAEQERVEARSDPGGVRAQQRAEAREDGSPRLQNGYSEARSFPPLLDERQGYPPFAMLTAGREPAKTSRSGTSA